MSDLRENPGAVNSLLERLRQRKLFQWAVAYLAGAWVLLQAIGLMSDFFGWPSRVGQAATVLLAIAFLAVLVVAWYHGERGQQRARPLEIVLVTAITLTAFAGSWWTWQNQSTVNTAVSDGTNAVSTASIAVLPFVNMSAEADNEFFSDGITEELLNALAKVDGLQVAARTSSFAFKGKNVAMGEVGRQLGVAHVLEGSVRRAGDQLRISAQLSSVANGYQLWSEKYDRPFKDVFAVQEEIAQAITAALRSRIVIAPTSAQLVQTTTDNPEAYTLYLQGRHLWGKRTESAVLRAIELYRRALDLDPEYALAYAGLADAHMVRANFNYAGPVEAFREVEANARKALALDSTLAEVHTTLGGVAYFHKYDWPAAERAFRKAIQLDARYALAHYWYSLLLSTMLRHAEALREAELAQRLDPLAPEIGVGVGHAYHAAGQNERALAEHRKTLEIDSTFFDGYGAVGGDLRALGRFEEAEAELKRMATLSGRDEALNFAVVYAWWGKHDLARRYLARGLAGRRETVRPPTVAAAYAWLGDHDEAFRWLERGWTERSPNMIRLGWNPTYAPIRSDPRFTEMLKRMKLPTE